MHCTHCNYIARGAPVTSEPLSGLPDPGDLTEPAQQAALALAEILGMRPAFGAISIDRANGEGEAVLTGPVRLWGFAKRWRVLATLHDGNDIDARDGFEVGVNLLDYEALLLTSPAVTGQIRWSFTPVRHG